MIRLAKQNGRYGYHKATVLLRMEGRWVKHKKIERLWGQEGLQLPRRHKKHRRLYHQNSSVIRPRPTYSNHIWAINFVHDKLSNECGYKMLTVLDEYTREALCVALRPKMNAHDFWTHCTRCCRNMASQSLSVLTTALSSLLCT